MNISEPFIRRPVGTSLLAAGVLLLGGVAYYFLPVASIRRLRRHRSPRHSSAALRKSPAYLKSLPLVR
jgi:hypothetical protein